jgi:2-hydroxychromene-2-carboxylate isomerase
VKKAPVKKHVPEHVHAAPKKKKSYVPYIIGAVAVIAIIVALIIRFSGTSPPPNLGDTSQYGSVKLDFYVMSQCPYGTQVEDAVAPVLKELGSNVDFELNFIAGETATGFESLHGQGEVDGDIIQLCVQKYFPEKLIEFVVCQNKDVQNMKGTIDSCANKVSIDAAKIKSCSDGEEGKQLLRDSIKKSEAVSAQGSPTMFLNDKPYTSGRDELSFKRAICGGLAGHPLCTDIPTCGSDADCRAEAGKVGVCENANKKDAKCSYKDDAKVTVTVLNSNDCDSCDTTQLVTVLKQVFLNLEVKEVEASSTAGKALIKQNGLVSAPSFVFDSSIEQTYAWSNNARLKAAFKKSGTGYVLMDEASGATYILDPAKRREIEEKTGVEKGDNKPQIDFYVMSYCPYGNMAEEGIEPVYQLLKSKADFNPHYVVYSNYGGGGPSYCMDDASQYCSMHGVQEMNQDIREICVHKYNGDAAYFKFILAMNKQCSASNADTCWEKVAKSVGIDTAKIKSCEADEGETLAAAELELNKLLRVQGSPTVFVEGSAYNGGRTPADYANALCAGFETAPDECSASNLAKLGTATPASTASAGGCG